MSRPRLYLNRRLRNTAAYIGLYSVAAFLLCSGINFCVFLEKLAPRGEVLLLCVIVFLLVSKVEVIVEVLGWR